MSFPTHKRQSEVERGQGCKAICEFRFESVPLSIAVGYFSTVVLALHRPFPFSPRLPLEGRVTIPILTSEEGRERGRGLPRPCLGETELGFEPKPFPHYIQQLCSHFD